jgi:3D (Asp-Asp-Asp) domain-containing protein
MTATIPPKTISVYDVREEVKTITYPMPEVYEYRQRIKLVATAYTASPDENGGRGGGITASGVKASYSRGTIAVPRYGVTFGTKVFIPELDKTFVAEDYGARSHIKWLNSITMRIDIFMNSKKEAFKFGVKKLEGYIYKSTE